MLYLKSDRHGGPPRCTYLRIQAGSIYVGAGEPQGNLGPNLYTEYSSL